MKNFTMWASRTLGFVLSIFTLNAQAQFCDEPQGTPGFPSDPICETAVCALDPFCCDTEWDGVCATTAGDTPECSGCLAGEAPVLCVAEPEAGVDVGNPCYDEVITSDPFCCETSWDGACQAAYEDCVSNLPDCAALPDPSEGVDLSNPCYTEVITNDAFCCETSWDGLCQAEYEDCLSAGPELCCQDTDGIGCPEAPACEALVCAVDPFCCDTEWDLACANFAEAECGEAECAGEPVEGCENTSGFGTATVSDNDQEIIITTCQFLSEYATINGVIGGETYVSTYTQDGVALGFVTVREGAPDGVAIASGQAPLTWTANVTGTHYVHYTVDDECNTATSCGVSTIQCTSCSPGEPVECVPAPECVTDEAAYETVILEDPFCCETEWDGLCQNAYDELSSTCIGTDEGCTYPTACNFDPAALFDDGSCEFTSCAGCTYPDALNFNPVALFDDGSCVFDPSDCVDNCPGDFNNDNVVNTSDLLTFLSVFGTVCEE